MGIPPPYILPGVTGITAGVGATRVGLLSVCEVEEWVWVWELELLLVGICIGITTPGIEGNTCCGPIGMITGAFTCACCCIAGCCLLRSGLRDLNNFLHSGLFSFGGGGGGTVVGSTMRAVTVCIVGALIVFLPPINLSLSSFFSLITFSRSSSCFLHSSWARWISVISLFWIISRALVLLAGDG